MNGVFFDPGSWKVGQTDHLWYLFTVVFVFIAYAFASWSISRAKKRFADDARWVQLFGRPNIASQYLQAGMVVGALLLIVLALLDLRYGKVSQEVPQRGIEVVFALDVSRSMLAEDVRPNRLERAKQMIRDTIDAMDGDSTGLVVFAGDAKQVIPVTNHRDEFRERLASISPDDLTRGGSRLGDAIRVSRDAFLTTSSDSRVIVMLTDGEDMESEPIKAARQARDAENITIFTIGLGDSTTGARVPKQSRQDRRIRTQLFAKFDGKEVWSKLEGNILNEIAKQGGGTYVPAGTKQVNMEDFYYSYLDRLPDSVLQTREIDQYETRYQWFLFPAIMLMIVGAGLGRPV